MVPSLSVIVRSLPPVLVGLFSRGVAVPADLPDSLWRLLTGQLGLDPEYVLTRIMTVFLNGRPVDDMETAVVRDGGVVGLAAAMPGLAGAVLRRGGILSGLRDTITQEAGTAGESRVPGRVTLKLFNHIAPEAGPLVLARGVLMDAADARALLFGPDTADRVRGLSLDDRAVALDDLKGLDGEVLVRLGTGPETDQRSGPE